MCKGTEFIINMLTDSVPDFHFHIPLLIGFYTVVD